MKKTKKERRRRGRSLTDDRVERLTTERAEQREEMGGMRGASCGVKSREMRWGCERTDNI